MNFDCVCAGIVVADHVCEPVEHVPAPGELILTSRMDLTIGGCASNVAVDLANLAKRVRLAGCVGDDVFGRYLREALENFGVNCDSLREVSNCDTSGTLVINSAGEDRRFIHSIGANREFSTRDLIDDLMNETRILYLGGYCLIDTLSAKDVAETFRKAKQQGVQTILDVVIPKPGDYWKMLEPVLEFTDIFMPNDDEARLITGLSEPMEQAKRFRQAGAKTVVVTCGDKGATLVSEAARLRCGVYPVDYVDGTGSGDAFVAGFIYGLLDNREPAECLRLGSALGASCVRQIGATSGVFQRDELEQFVESRTLAIDECDTGSNK